MLGHRYEIQYTNNKVWKMKYVCVYLVLVQYTYLESSIVHSLSWYSVVIE